MTVVRNRRVAAGAFIILMSSAAGAIVIACTTFSSSDGTAPPSNDGGTDAVAADASTLPGDGSVPSDASPQCSPTAAFESITLMEALNSPSNEYQVRLTNDLLTAYFSSDRETPDGAVTPAGNLYSVSRASPDANFATKDIVDVLGPTPAENRLSPSVTADNETLYYVVDVDGGAYTMQRAIRGKTSDPFGIPMTIPISPGNVNDTSVYVVPGGDTLYFSSDRAGGAGHLYFSHPSNGSFDKPQSLSELDKVSPQQANPVVTPDELTIYFSAVGHIHMATRASKTDHFGPATEVTQLSSNGAEGPSFIAPDGCDLYFFSNREGGAGGYDLYRAHRSP